LIPEENRRNLQEIPDNIKRHLDIRPVRWIEEVLDVALQRVPSPQKAEPSELKEKTTQQEEVEQETTSQKNQGLQTH